MDKRTRAYKIYQAGIDATGVDSISMDPNVLQFIAGMLDYATKKPVKKKSEVTTKVSPTKAFQILKASGAVDCEPLDKRWFGRLGKELANLDLTEQDVNDIADHLSAGGWRGPRPDFGKLLRFLGELAVEARGGGRAAVTGKVLKHV